MNEADELYGLSPSDFTPARNELARRLKKEGREDDAAQVKALRKPTLALWAVNRAARRHPGETRRFVELGDEVRRAQVEGRAADFRAAMKERSAALGRLLDFVRAILSEVGGAPSHAERAGRTIEAAAAGDGAEREALLAGALRAELEPGGFGGVFGAVPAEPEIDESTERRVAEAEKARGHADSLIVRARDARREALRLEREAKEAEGRALSARRAAERAAAAAEKAEAAAEDAARRADELLG